MQNFFFFFFFFIWHSYFKNSSVPIFIATIKDREGNDKYLSAACCTGVKNIILINYCMFGRLGTKRQLSGFPGPVPNAVVLTSPISTVKLRKVLKAFQDQ